MHFLKHFESFGGHFEFFGGHLELFLRIPGLLIKLWKQIGLPFLVAKAAKKIQNEF